MGRFSKRALTVMVAVTTALGTVALTPPAQAQPQPLPLDTAAAEQLLDDYVSAGRTPGVLLEISTPDRTWSTAKGLANTATGTPMSIDLQHRIGSITKTFTTTVVLQLIADGLLALDDPVSRYVPGVPNGDRITVRMLGDMTSGLADYLANQQFYSALLADPHRRWSAEELLAASYALGPQFAPGTDWSYSNANTVLLGLVVENLTGKPFAHVLDEKILTPHGLTRTSYPAGNHFSENHTFGYTVELPDRPMTDATFWSPSYGNAAGQMISTAGDLTKWLRLLGTGALLTPQLHAERLAWLPVGANNDSFHYVFGMADFGGWLGHTGEIFGFETAAVYHPGLDTTIVLAVNTDKQLGGEPTAHALLRELGRLLFPANPVEVPVV
ncbi:serine hydrolase domain-containing protein [Mycolicibacterium pulveris]|uniref:serine hydrolase domain-containing protein n=1 Tax=Mycolicibacterium pulveris TaxID=36813 RepID=UPI003CF18514